MGIDIVEIALFHHTLRVGSGIDTVIYELATRLSDKANVTLFCFMTDFDTQNLKFDVDVIDSWTTRGTNRTMMIAPFLLDRLGSFRDRIEKFDIINTHHYPANYVCRNLRNPLKIVTEWSGVTTSMFSTIKEKVFIGWAKHCNRVAAEKADVLIAPCDFVHRWIREMYSMDSKTLLLDGVNFHTFDRSIVSSQRFFDLFPNLKNKKIILFVGRITESKNIHALIEIFAKVKKEIEDSALVLVGNFESYPSYYRRLGDLISSRGISDVIFAGIVPWKDLPSFFAACDVYATCSLWEGFLRAEAFAFGKPIVCYNVGANYETVRNNENGFIVDKLDSDKFTSSLLILLSDTRLATQMGEKGYKWAKDNLDFDIISEKFFNFCVDQVTR